MRAASCTRTSLSLADSETVTDGDVLAVADTAVGSTRRLGFSESAAASAGGVPTASPVASFIGEPGTGVVGASLDDAGSGAVRDGTTGTGVCVACSERLPRPGTISFRREKPGSGSVEGGVAVPVATADEPTSVVFVLSRHKARNVIITMAIRAVTAMNVRLIIRIYPTLNEVETALLHLAVVGVRIPPPAGDRQAKTPNNLATKRTSPVMLGSRVMHWRLRIMRITSKPLMVA